MGLLERIADAQGRGETRYGMDQYIQDYILPGGYFTYAGQQYPYGWSGNALGLTQTYAGQKVTQVAPTLPGYMQAIAQSPPAFAAEMVRALVLSQARFVFRNKAWSATPRRQFGTSALGLLEAPWPRGSTGDLISLMEWHAGLAGMAYVVRRSDSTGAPRLRVLRPDWVGLIHGSEMEPDDPAGAVDAELIGIVYANRGLGYGKPQTFLADEVAIWAPLPDPVNPGMGMSWITPAVRDIQGDIAATQHKLTFFANGATPNMVVKGITAANKSEFDKIVEMLEERHTGLANAYKTLYLTAGADATVVGSNLQQLEFAGTQGKGETRVALLSRVPAPILQISEGLAGSSLNAGNFGMARRIFADSWVYPTLQDLACTLSALVRVPGDAELWFDTSDIPLLREDARDAAEIEQIKMNTITGYTKEGFVPDSAIAATRGQDVNLLKHTGLLSVQLQKPGEQMPTQSPPDAAAAARAQDAAFMALVADEADPDVAELRAGNAEQLHRYWVAGKGLAKWAFSPHPWTSLYHHLVKYMPPEEAKRTAAEWFHEHFGFWPGSDLNRVTHGKPPRGHKIGPG